jgi:hypothetical protein
MSLLSDIITSKVRIKILELLFADPNEMYHVRGIVREIKEEINAVRRELGKRDCGNYKEGKSWKQNLLLGTGRLPNVW